MGMLHIFLNVTVTDKIYLFAEMNLAAFIER